MLSTITGTVREKGDAFAVLEAAGLGFKLFTNHRTLAALPPMGETATLFVHLHVKEEGIELYGFTEEAERRFFELLLSVSGVGPRSALAVLRVADLTKLAAAIQEGRPDLLTQAAGIGRKTAERIILDLRGKVAADRSGAVVKNMESDADIMEALVGLGYRRGEAQAALNNVPAAVVGMEKRLKAALALLGKQ